MNKNVIASIEKTQEILFKYKFNPKTRFGQNFMIKNTIPTIISELDIFDKEKTIIEIGPGIGALTQFLLSKVNKVIAYEIDSDLIPILKEEFKEDNFEVINKDFLKIELDDVKKKCNNELIVVSNLPYYITSDLMKKLLNNEDSFIIVAMMQKEVAHRILDNKQSEINEITFISNYFSEVFKITEVSKNDFFPRPNVDSTVLMFKSKNISNKKEILEVFNNLMKFKRKILYSNLCKNYDNVKIESLYNELNIDKTIRLEQLSFDQISFICNFLK